MANVVNSYEEKYANESFENDTDEIPEISETESESDNEAVSRSNTLYAYARSRLNGRANTASYSRNNTAYDSSTDDDNDVVVNETIAEINTEPMRMEEALLTPKMNSVRRQSGRKSESMRSATMSAGRKILFKNKSLEELIAKAEKQTDSEHSELSDNSNDSEQVEEPEENALNDLDKRAPKELDNIVIHENDILLTSSMLQPDGHSTENLMTLEAAMPDEYENDLNRPLMEKFDKEVVNYEDNIGNHLDKCPKAAEDAAAEEDAEADEDEEADDDDDDEEADDEPENHYSDCAPKFDVQITSQTPTSFNTDEYAFHLNFVNRSMSNERLKLRPAQRKSWSFSNARMREIERQNQILLKKILTQKPTYVLNTPKKTKQQNKFASLPPTTRTTSAAVNRKKQQRQIDLDNQGLKRRIEAISLRRPLIQNLN